MNNNPNLKWGLLIEIFLLLILSFFIQAIIFQPSLSELYEEEEGISINNMELVNLHYDELTNTFIADSPDAKIIFPQLPEGDYSIIKITFSNSISPQTLVELYYSEKDALFSEENTISYYAEENCKSMYFKCPVNRIDAFCLDISENSFGLESVYVYSNIYNFFDKILFNSSSNIFNTVSIFVCLMFCLTIYKLLKKRNFAFIIRKENLFLLCLCGLMVACALVIPTNAAPDEAMRMELVDYICKTRRLPLGGEKSIRNEIWGFSYAFFPYLSSIISAMFANIISAFWENKSLILLGARLANVLLGSITVYFNIKIGEFLFSGREKWIFITVTSCLPQFIFLCSYVNNDIIALLAINILVYFWIYGYKNEWDYKSVIGIGIGISVCILSYYNAYPYILATMLFCISSSLKFKQKVGCILKKVMLISAMAFGTAGWFFIRNAVAYDGDFLGLNTVSKYKELYGSEIIKGNTKLIESGTSVREMLLDMPWLEHTIDSFIGIFGYMNVRVHYFIYTYYKFIFWFALVGIISIIYLKFVHHSYNKEGQFLDRLLFICFLFGGILVFGLSIYNSYANDYQPQGRYIIGCLLPLAYFIAKGFEAISSIVLRVTNKIYFTSVVAAISILNILIIVYIYISTILENYLTLVS